jgi:hypothetical protein
MAADNLAMVAVSDERAVLSVTLAISPLMSGPIPPHMETTRYEESVSFIQYAWKSGWLIVVYRCSPCGEWEVEVACRVKSKRCPDIKKQCKYWQMAARADKIQVPAEMQGDANGFDCRVGKLDPIIGVHFEYVGAFGETVPTPVWEESDSLRATFDEAESTHVGCEL